MRKVIYFIFAGLTIAGLASCEKQELKTKDVYTIEVVNETITKADASIEVDSKKRFHATLKKNGTPIDCSSWNWSPDAVVSSSEQGIETYKDVKSGYIDVVGVSEGSGQITASTNAGGSSISGYKNISVVAKSKADVRIINQIDDEWGQSDGKSSGDRYKVWYYNLVNFSSFEGTVYVKYKFKNNANAPEVTQEGTYTVPANGRKTLVGVQDSNGGYFEKLAFEIR